MIERRYVVYRKAIEYVRHPEYVLLYCLSVAREAGVVR